MDGYVMLKTFRVVRSPIADRVPEDPNRLDADGFLDDGATFEMDSCSGDGVAKTWLPAGRYLAVPIQLPDEEAAEELRSRWMREAADG